MVNSHNKPQLSLPSSPSHSSHHYTPGPSFSAMVEDVGRLNIDTRSSDIDVRRCLFPMSESPTINTKGLAQLNICGTFEVQQNVDLKSSTSWLVGKKANRSRLRRLWNYPKQYYSLCNRLLLLSFCIWTSILSYIHNLSLLYSKTSYILSEQAI